jgi:hypothetical protein
MCALFSVSPKCLNFSELQGFYKEQSGCVLVQDVCFRQLLYSTKVKTSFAFDFLQLLQSLHYMQLELAENKDAIYSERNKMELGLIKITSLFL